MVVKSGRHQTLRDYGKKSGYGAALRRAEDWTYNEDCVRAIMDNLNQQGFLQNMIPPESTYEQSRDALFVNTLNESDSKTSSKGMYKPKNQDAIEAVKALQKRMAETLDEEGKPLYRRPDGSPGPIDGKIGKWSLAAMEAVRQNPALLKPSEVVPDLGSKDRKIEQAPAISEARAALLKDKAIRRGEIPDTDGGDANSARAALNADKAERSGGEGSLTVPPRLPPTSRGGPVSK